MAGGESAFSFLSGVVQDHDTVIVVAQIDELADLGEPDSMLMRWSRDDGWVALDLEWAATRVCVQGAPPRVLATGPEGRVVIRDADGVREEVIDASENGPSRHGIIRDLRTIGDEAFAAGMGRQVYRRVQGSWVHADAGVLAEPDTESVVGFNAIDGIDPATLHAVGFGGEIWFHADGSWRPATSPTNLILNDVHAVGVERVYACGQQGTLLVGAGEAWRPIEHDATEDQLWSLQWFGGRLYVAADEHITRLTDSGSLEPVDTGLGEEGTFGFLHAREGLLLSVGQKHVCVSEDGVGWTDITP